MKNFKKILLRIITILTLIVFLTSVSFFTYNKKVVKGAVFDTIALGTSALGALVAAYFATAGVTFSGSSDTNGDFLGNFVSNWVKNSSSFASNPYFNSSGEFIGSSDDLSIVQNNDSDVVSIIFGKDFAAWLEVLKQSFVSDNSLTSSSSTNLMDESVLNIYDGSVPFTFTSDYVQYDFGYLPFSHPSVIDFSSSGSVTYHLSENYYLYVSHSDPVLTNGVKRFSIVLYDQNSGTISSSTNWNVAYPESDSVIAVFTTRHSNELCFCVGVPMSTNYGRIYGISNNIYRTALTVNSEDISNITLTGELTEGYSDFEDAINQDLTNADEDEVAVVGVGEFPETLDVSNILDGILDKIIAGTLNPTYEGTRENMGEAEEETEGEKPFVPEVPEGWVVVDGLEDFFPFCIPWDLYNIIAVLNVPPEAPRFEYEISFGKESFEKEKVIVDLAPFNTVASIFRIMMAVGFVVFLIIKTRDLIRG